MIDEAELARLEQLTRQEPNPITWWGQSTKKLITEVRRLQELSRGRFDENKELWQWFNASQRRVQELEAALEQRDSMLRELAPTVAYAMAQTWTPEQLAEARALLGEEQ